MNQKTVKVAGQVSVIIFIIGLLVISPPLRFALFVIASLCAAVPAIFTSGKWRIAGIVIGIAALALALIEFPDARSHIEQYRQRPKPQTATGFLRGAACIHETGKDRRCIKG
jgi:hypothetical protein